MKIKTLINSIFRQDYNQEINIYYEPSGRIKFGSYIIKLEPITKDIIVKSSFINFDLFAKFEPKINEKINRFLDKNYIKTVLNEKNTHFIIWNTDACPHNIQIFGEQYLLRWDFRTSKKVEYDLNTELKTLTIRCNVSNLSNSNHRRKIFINCLSDIFLKYLQNRQKHWSELMETHNPNIEVKHSIKTYLGKNYCKGFKIVYSLSMLSSSVGLIDVLILHELNHNIYSKHDKLFYDNMEKYITNAKYIDKNEVKKVKVIID
ncbi:YgjP-like metallopeptidase domain-containing protein [Mycoplasmopsis felifaucium]|uniref:YgjP-like metallopeptidase domain-containing protein n=1 Tax=Mycoplasmopsis felifaucium TaxID=35768 RepID=UPI000480711D|nr:YgjP-like metallopeptidase domain-containing protein [Mycoplasmopsis felifaucium]